MKSSELALGRRIIKSLQNPCLVDTHLGNFAQRYAKRFLHATLRAQGLDPKAVYDLAERLEGLPYVGNEGTDLVPHQSTAMRVQLIVRYSGPENIGLVINAEEETGHEQVLAYLEKETGVEFVDPLPSTSERSCTAYALVRSARASAIKKRDYGRLEVILRKV